MTAARHGVALSPKKGHSGESTARMSHGRSACCNTGLRHADTEDGHATTVNVVAQTQICGASTPQLHGHRLLGQKQAAEPGQHVDAI
jgi:hypothetical protein